MRSATTRAKALDSLVAALRSGQFEEAVARELYTLGPATVTLALLAAARRIAEQDARLVEQDGRLALLEKQAQSAGGNSPGTPSGMQPVHTKSNVPDGRTTTGRPM